MLIIEGPDMVGKSQLAAKLVDAVSKVLDRRMYPSLIRCSTEMNNGTQDQVYARHVGLIQTMRIADRFHLSHVAYGLALERPKPDLLHYQNWQNLMWALNQIKSLTVLVLPSKEKMVDLIDKHWADSQEVAEDGSGSLAGLRGRLMAVRDIYAGFVSGDVLESLATWQVSDDMNSGRLMIIPPYPSENDKLVEEIARVYVQLQRSIPDAVQSSEVGIWLADRQLNAMRQASIASQHMTTVAATNDDRRVQAIEDSYGVAPRRAGEGIGTLCDKKA